jgi:hypothetical protein
MIHANSIQAHHEQRQILSRRALLVVAWFELNGPATDRQAMHGLGFKEPNAGRPRITEAVQSGQLIELRSVRCPETGKTVRVVGRPPKQMELIAA